MSNQQKLSPWHNQRVLITGVCGSVGQELLRQVINYAPAEIIGLDNNESELFFLNEAYRDTPNVHLFLGDVRDRDKLSWAMRGVDIVLHTAAFKHVIICEQSPGTAIQTNILGVQNVIDAAYQNRVKRVLFTSSDKAVNPTNVMGTSKLMGERLMTAANARRRGDGPIFASTRFGNVLGSRGSVIPLFKKQIANGGPVTLTDPRMTRFIMTLQQAVRLVMDSTFLACGGEVFVTKMPVVKIADLARVMIDVLAPRYGFAPEQIEIKIIGVKPGEKMYEELLNEEEIRRTIELPDYFVVLPAFQSVYEPIKYQYPSMNEAGVARPYNSAVETPISQAELKDYLLTHQLI
ncbi:MAG: NAD-dependent epimerase/dehydratase family protein [Chloroflexi bacterium]|nr:MAG: NAD-dependent epimerase/dehydratase family protein [Chloroflexota bacterium]